MQPRSHELSTGRPRTTTDDAMVIPRVFPITRPHLTPPVILSLSPRSEPIVPASRQMTQAVADALKNAQLGPRDRGGVQLVRRYAQLLDAARGRDDEVEVYVDLGPKLLAALTALGLTVAGRSKGGGQDERPGSAKLDELRARRAERAG